MMTSDSILTASLLAILWYLPAAELRAAEDTVTLRVVGFSHPEREEDFRQVVAGLPELSLVDLKIDRGEVTLRYDRTALFPTLKPDQPILPEKLIEQIDKLVGQASNRTFTLTAPLMTPEDKLAKEEITVGLLDCKACRYAVYIAVAKIEGVERASVSDASVLTAWIDASKTNREALVEALKNARVELPES
jgi:hypothetical protein